MAVCVKGSNAVGILFNINSGWSGLFSFTKKDNFNSLFRDLWIKYRFPLILPRGNLLTHFLYTLALSLMAIFT